MEPNHSHLEVFLERAQHNLYHLLVLEVPRLNHHLYLVEHQPEQLALDVDQNLEDVFVIPIIPPSKILNLQNPLSLKQQGQGLVFLIKV